MNNDFKYMDEAQEASRSSGFSNFGKLTIEQVGMKMWVRDGDGNISGRPVDITQAEWDRLSKRDKFVEVKFCIDVQEFNPALEFTYERKVSILGGKSSDWAKIVQPSIDKVFGKGKQLSQINGLYVEALDVPQLNDPEFNTIQFVRAFKNRDEAFAAYQAKRGDAATGTSPAAPAVDGGDFPQMYGSATAWQQAVVAIKDELAKGKSMPDVASIFGVDVSWIVKAQSS